MVGPPLRSSIQVLLGSVPASHHPGSPLIAASGDGRAAARHGTLTVAGESEGLPQAVTYHRHLQADAVAQLLGAEVDGAPHQAGEGIVLGAVARPQPAEAGTGQRCCPALGFAPPSKNRLFWGILQWDAPASGCTKSPGKGSGTAGYSHIQHVAESSHLLIPLLGDFEELVAAGEGVRPGGNLRGRARAHQLAAASPGAPAHRPPGPGFAGSPR